MSYEQIKEFTKYCFSIFAIAEIQAENDGEKVIKALTKLPTSEYYPDLPYCPTPVIDLGGEFAGHYGIHRILESSKYENFEEYFNKCIRGKDKPYFVNIRKWVDRIEDKFIDVDFEVRDGKPSKILKVDTLLFTNDGYVVDKFQNNKIKELKIVQTYFNKDTIKRLWCSQVKKDDTTFNISCSLSKDNSIYEAEEEIKLTIDNKQRKLLEANYLLNHWGAPEFEKDIKQDDIITFNEISEALYPKRASQKLLEGLHRLSSSMVNRLNKIQTVSHSKNT